MFTKYKTIIKKDYHGNLYETTVIDEPKPDLGELWSEFRKRFLSSVENSNKLKPGQPTIIKSWTEREEQKQLSNDEK